MSINIELNKAQLSKIIQSDGFFGNMMGNLGRQVLIGFPVLVAKDVLSKFGTKAISSILDKSE